MSGEPLRGPSMVFFSEGMVVKNFFFFFGGGGVVKEGVGVLCFWTWHGAVSNLSGLPYSYVCYRSKLHISGNK